MKKSLILLASLFTLGSFVPFVSAEGNPNQERIEEIEAQIKELQAELKELKGDDDNADEDGDAHSIGDEVEIGDYVIKIKEASYTDERNQYEDVDPENVLVLTFEITNNSKEDLLFTGANFKVYIDGKEMDTYPISDVALGTIAPGRTKEAKSGYAIFGNGDVEVEWTPTFNFDKLRALWKLAPENIN